MLKSIWDNAPDLDAAFEAVKGELFGPLDPALVKLKHKEIVEVAKDKREQELDPRGRSSLARDDQAERDRKDRLETLLLIITTAKLAEKLRETYAGLDDIRDRAREILDRICHLKEKMQQDYRDLMDNTARHPVTGERIFRYADGHIETEDGRTVPPDEVKGADFTGKTTGEQKDAAQSRMSELDHYEEEVTGIDRQAQTHQERITDPNLDEKQREQAVDEAAKDTDRMRSRLDEIGGKLGTKLRADHELSQEAILEAKASSSASITVPSL